MGGKVSKSVSVIIPIYNEEKIIESAIKQCIDALEEGFEDYELIIVNDGSKDSTQSIIERLCKENKHILLLPNYVNLNQGISVQRGMVAASKDYIVHNGIDLPLKPSEIKNEIEKIGDTDVLIFERKTYSGATTWRLLTSNINILLRRLLFPQLASGFKDMNFTQIYRGAIIKEIIPLAKSPAFTTPEMIIRARLKGYKIKTVDAEFVERKSGKGSLGKPHDIVWTIYDMIRFRYLLWIGIERHGKAK
jgi:dolichol-phosphate mannosyltransferase